MKMQCLFFTPPFIFYIFVNHSGGTNGSFRQTKIVTDEGDGVGATRASAGCEVLVDWADGRETFPSNFYNLAEFLHR